MNREEAIDRLKGLFGNGYSKQEEALNIAIKALEQQPCEDAIDRAEAIKIASGYCHPANVAKELAKLPSVNPTKTGHWIWCVGSHKCSNCEEYTCFSHKELLRYCPNCGAKMIEPQESEE